MQKSSKYNVVVIGGGPAGMMAAGRAGELGARVLLLEKNFKLGTKLLMTGNGRCNLTNAIGDREMITKFGKGGKFLFSALSRFGSEDAINFFESRGVKTKIEDNNRVLPRSDKAQDVLNALLGYLKESKVDVWTGADVKKVITKDNKVERIVIGDGKEIVADKFIIATGGKSYPKSGSTGDAYKWLGKLGHEIIKTSPALAPIILQDNLVKDLEGLSLKDVNINLMEVSSGKTIASETGEAIFTSQGMSGPAILNLSRSLVGIDKKLKLRIDLFPGMTIEDLGAKIRAEFDVAKNKSVANILEKTIPKRLVAILLRLANIEGTTQANSIRKEQRKSLSCLLKQLDLSVKGLAGFDRAMVTAGGVKLSEVDPKTMRSKIISNLYLAGEILDLDGPTGGFNLQVCWSTGYAAGESVVK